MPQPSPDRARQALDVSVVIPTFNRADDLADLLGCLAAQRVPAGLTWEVIVVDNGSTDHTAAVVEAWEAWLPLRRDFEPQRGSSFARNRGVLRARGQLIVFVDSDVLVGPDWLPSFVAAAAAYPDHTYFGGLQRPHYLAVPPRWYAGVGQGTRAADEMGGEPRPATHVCGANWACRTDALLAAGLFDPRLGPKDLPRLDRRVVGNDAHLMDRLQAAGLRGLLLPTEATVIAHKIRAEEMQWGYTLRWYFGFGRGEALRSAWTPTLLLGVPRWRVRQGLREVVSLLGAVLLVRRSVAVTRLMRVARTAGYIYECRRR